MAQSQSNALRRSKSLQGAIPKPKFLVEFPPPTIIEEEGDEKWTLRCICQEKTISGLLVGCEKCGCWQHAICVGLNQHTVPDKYICETCGHRPIRCKCNNNLNYLFSLIQCTHCGYYVHRRCVGLLFGPLPRGDYVCNFCGKSKLTYPKIKLSHNVKIDNDITYTFTQDKVENLPNHIYNSPFNDFLSIDIDEATLNYREFCESFYDRFRSFFFICHPLNPSLISRKKRHNLFQSFLTGSKYLCNHFYGLDEEQFTWIFNDLLFNDIYRTDVEIKEPFETGCKLTENTTFELGRIQGNLLKLPSVPEPSLSNVKENGLFTAVDLKKGQFVTVAEGLVGDLEEFNYDDGVDFRFYQIADTRLVLDTSHIEFSPLHKMRRSMFGNCVLKLFEVGSSVYCGVFVGDASLSPGSSTEEFIKAGDELTLGIDFIPGILEELNKWIGWHCTAPDDKVENKPIREEKETPSVTRHTDNRRQKSPKTKKKDQLIGKKNRGRKPKKGSEPILNTDLTLFDLFDNDGPCTYMFTVTDDVEQYEQMMLENQQQVKIQKPTNNAQKRSGNPQSKTYLRNSNVSQQTAVKRNQNEQPKSEITPEIFSFSPEVELVLESNEVPQYAPLIRGDPIESMKFLLGLG
ncbi:PHD-finger family protein [Histomonas meleagridis]|uniref:PHD-finger family protein n=1 Tax=Histomonas meleagridis TaxID=135588 RepID=UPI00355ACAAD|nr:PHD-finger family protein [Histomonas meleagridis]KAH0797845.1 PHD-finger family protein [Histomonas meleagridis]